jgi:F-type H+-transporting ATPase subunit a
MAEAHVGPMEFPNIVSILARHYEGTPLGNFLHTWEGVIFAALAGLFLAAVVFVASRRTSVVPGRLQNIVELYVQVADYFVCGILGPHGRRYTPFIGTLFIYILTMNLMGLIPLLRSPTSDWSTTAALAICVFIYVQYTAFKEMGVLGYADHLAGKPRGALALSILFPFFMFMLHLMTELLKPLTLSLRLRSNIWGDDLLLVVLANFGLKGIPMFIFGMMLALVAATIQAMVFAILTTIYFGLVLMHE